jgi:tRNA pseudouridine65 synthase
LSTNTGEIDIIYSDESLVAVSKPGGLLVHRTKESTDREFLLQTLSSQIGRFLYPVHRLDRAASGVMMFARTSEDARLLQRTIVDESTLKEYLVLVRGSTPARWESTRPLSKRKGVQVPAHSIFEKVAEFSRLSLLRARILTGRRHQIRRHLAREAHQVLGDTTYGKGRINQYFREQYGLPRLFLHACRLEFRHPRTGEPLVLRDRLAADLRAFLQRLPDCDSAVIGSL